MSFILINIFSGELLIKMFPLFFVVAVVRHTKRVICGEALRGKSIDERCEEKERNLSHLFN